MAADDPLHQIDSIDLDTTDPTVPWTGQDFDGPAARNERDAALAKRDRRLLTLIRALKDHGTANVSPLYPFKADATRTPSSAIAYDTSDAVLSTFSIVPGDLTLSKDFIKDLKLILANDFKDPYLSKLTLREGTDPDTSLVRVFVDLEFSARFTRDQTDHVVFTLTSKAFNDVLDNSAPSSRDNTPFELERLAVAGKSYLNSGLIEFSFIGSVHSQLLTAWSVGTYSTQKVEGFSSIAQLAKIVFTFTRQATAIAQLAYNNLGDLQNAVPFLAKVKHFPFDPDATAAPTLSKYILDCQVTGPAKGRVFLKRIRKAGANYVFVFAFNERDSLGNLLATVNVGVATITPTSGNVVPIVTLGSNKLAGVDPTWLDEVPGTVRDSFGAGRLKIVDYASLQALFDEFLAVTVAVGSPSPILVSPAQNPATIGIFVDPDEIVMLEDNSFLDGLAVDTVALPISIKERVLGNSHLTKHVQVSIDGIVVNRRTSYGSENSMRDFYGLSSTESLVDNDKIPLDDEWFDSAQSALKRYQVVGGHRKWRTV